MTLLGWISISCPNKLPQTQWLKIMWIYHLSVLEARSPNGSQSAKVKVWVRLNSFGWPASFFGIWLLASFLLFKDSSIASTNSDPSSTFFFFNYSTIKDPCDYIGSMWIIQDNLPISRSLITSMKSFLPCQIICSWVPRIGMGTYLGGHYSAHHIYHSIISTELTNTLFIK